MDVTFRRYTPPDKWFGNRALIRLNRFVPLDSHRRHKEWKSDAKRFSLLKISSTRSGTRYWDICSNPLVNIFHWTWPAEGSHGFRADTVEAAGSIKSCWPKVTFYAALDDSEPALSPGLHNLHLNLQRDSSERSVVSMGGQVPSLSQPHEWGGCGTRMGVSKSMRILGAGMIIYPLLLSSQDSTTRFCHQTVLRVSAVKSKFQLQVKRVLSSCSVFLSRNLESNRNRRGTVIIPFFVEGCRQNGNPQACSKGRSSPGVPASRVRIWG